MITPRRVRVPVDALALAGLALIAAAADVEAPALAGTVAFDGRPVAAGTIVFHLDDDEFVGTRIKDGAYKLTRVPAGRWRVTVRGDGTRRVPTKYSLVETSGLIVTVKAGINTIDFDLEN